MSEKSHPTPPNVRIIAKNNQTWSVDWADDPNSYCRSFNTRSRELNLGLTATPHFPKAKPRTWLRYVACAVGIGALGAVVKLWLFSPYWIFFNPHRDLVFRYDTRIHFWCNAPPTHFIHFKDGAIVTAKLIDPRYGPTGGIFAFGRMDDTTQMEYPVARFEAKRHDRSTPTLHAE